MALAFVELADSFGLNNRCLLFGSSLVVLTVTYYDSAACKRLCAKCSDFSNTARKSCRFCDVLQRASLGGRDSASQRSLHNAPIFRLLLKVAVKGTHQCDLLYFCGDMLFPNSYRK